MLKWMRPNVDKRHIRTSSEKWKTSIIWGILTGLVTREAGFKTKSPINRDMNIIALSLKAKR